MARLVRLTGLVLGLGLALLDGAAASTGVRVDRSVLDALGPAPRQPIAPGVESPPREPRRAARRPAAGRPAEAATKDGVVTVPPPPPVTALPPREAGGPRPLAPSLLPPSVRPPEPPRAAQPATAQAAAAQPAPAQPASAPAAPPAATPAPPPSPPPAPVAALPPSPATPTAAAPAARPAPAPAPTPAPVAGTAAPPPGAQLLRLGFQGAETELDAASRQRVLGFAASVPDDESVRVTVNAYAGGDPADPSRARRTALSRALAVRTALMEGGIRSTRIDVRALGLAAGDGPPDRVDIIAGSAR